MGRILNFILLAFLFFNTYAHPKWEKHEIEMRSVLGLKEDYRLREWGRFISSEMIDNSKFPLLEIEFKRFNFSNPYNHRLLFHWPYDAKPWSLKLEKHIYKNCKTDQGANDTIYLLKTALIEEQKNRNKKINSKTESLFGFASGGMEGKCANNIAGLVYNIHLLGDYMSDDNSIITIENALPEIEYLITNIQNILKDLDLEESSNLRDKIENIKNSSKKAWIKADELMPLMIKETPPIIKKAKGGFIKGRFEYKGFQFIEEDEPWYKFW